MLLMGKGWLHVLLYSVEKRLLGYQNIMDEPKYIKKLEDVGEEKNQCFYIQDKRFAATSQ